MKSFNKIQNIHNIKKPIIETSLNSQYFNSNQTPKQSKIVFQNPYVSRHLAPFNSVEGPIYPTMNSPHKIKSNN
jgi:hypothetical protein